MIDITLSIDAYRKESFVKRDGDDVGEHEGLYAFPTRFLQVAAKVPEIVRNDYNDSEFRLTVESEDWEARFLTALFKDMPGCAGVTRQEHPAPFDKSFESRVQIFVELARRYRKTAALATKAEIKVFAPGQEAALDALSVAIHTELPELGDMGFSVVACDAPCEINIVSEGTEISVPKAKDALVCVVGAPMKPVVKAGAIFWQDSAEILTDVLKAYVFRFFGIPFLLDNLRVLNLNLDREKVSEEDHRAYLLLDRVRDGLVIEIPDVVETGGAAQIRITSLTGHTVPDVRAESSYPESVAVSQADVLRLEGVREGDSEVRIFRVGESRPIQVKKVRTVDFGYAIDVKILINGDILKADEIHEVPTGTSLTLSAAVRPDEENSHRDLANARWSIVNGTESEEMRGSEVVFCPKTPGEYTIGINLARVSDFVRVAVRPCLEDFKVTLDYVAGKPVNKQESDAAGNITRVAAYVGTALVFGIKRIPENCLVPHGVSVSCLTNFAGGFVNANTYRVNINEYLGAETLDVDFEFRGTGKKRRVSVKTESTFSQPREADDTLLLCTVVALSVIDFFTLLLIENLSFFCILFSVAVIGFNVFARKKAKQDITRTIIKMLLGLLGFAAVYALFMEYFW